MKPVLAWQGEGVWGRCGCAAAGVAHNGDGHSLRPQMRGGGSVCVCSLHGRERECFPHHRQLLLDETGSQRRNLVPVHQRPPAEALTETLTEIRTKISTKILSETETVPRAEALVEDNTVSVSVEGTAQKRTRLAARGKLRLLAVLGATALVEGAVAGGVGQVEGRGCEGGCEGAHAVETNAVRAVDPPEEGGDAGEAGAAAGRVCVCVFLSGGVLDVSHRRWEVGK